VGVGVLLVLYPLIDAVASVLDARSQHGSARQLLLANAAFSAVAAVALGVAATGSKANVLVVFGVWAFVAGAAQLVVVLRRRAQLGNQWPLLLANGVSVLGGIVFIIGSTRRRSEAEDDCDLRGHRGSGIRHPGLAARAAPSPPANPAGPIPSTS
jgi:uncharacterized membrane protein HdeD (DUF308 family)